MSFLWPPNGSFAYVSSGSVNIFDTLEVSYTSTWGALNFTLFCQIGDVSTDYGVWQAPSNPMAASGIYRLNSIYTAGFNIVKFPTECAFRMTEYGNSEVYNAGQFFEVISQPGESTTYSPTSTSVTSSTSQSSQTSASPASSTSISASQITDGASSLSRTSPASVTAISSSSASPATTIKPIAQDAGLSIGAKTGIGVGAAIAVLVLAALCFFIFRLRRKANIRKSEEPIDSKAGLPAYANLEGQTPMYKMQEMEETSRVELPSQQRTIGPRELE